MHNWFECKISFEKMMENGMQKKVTEPYLVDALSFTEAEARIIEEIRPFISSTRTATVSTKSKFTSSPSTRRAAPKKKQPPKCWHKRRT